MTTAKKKPTKAPVKQKPDDGITVNEKREVTLTKGECEVEVANDGEGPVINLSTSEGGVKIHTDEVDDVIALLRRSKEFTK